MMASNGPCPYTSGTQPYPQADCRKAPIMKLRSAAVAALLCLASLLISAVPASAQASPFVTSIVPNTGSTAGGTVVTLNGSNFGTNAALATVTIGGNLC